jgi:hypothetical protein
MDVGLPGRAFENPGEQVVLLRQNAVADGADPRPGLFTAKAKHTALNVHHPVMAVKGGKGYRFNQLKVFQPGRTKRAALGLPRPAFPGFPKLRAGFYQRGGAALPEKQSVPEPEKGESGKHQSENGQHGSRYYSRKV